LIYATPLIGIVALVAMMVFFWKRYGPGSGRSLGNKIASHLGIQRGLFYSILDHGVKDSRRDVLAALEKSKVGVEAASIQIAPTLLRGIERLEAHFGEQEMVNDAKPRISKLLVGIETKK
jgi:hypothetical protein